MKNKLKWLIEQRDYAQSRYGVQNWYSIPIAKLDDLFKLAIEAESSCLELKENVDRLKKRCEELEKALKELGEKNVNDKY